jgi:hypothetical protein
VYYISYFMGNLFEKGKKKRNINPKILIHIANKSQ